jgi:uncharacterized protein (TIGR03545 family)
LDVEMSSVLRKKLIVREGRISGLQFHTERDSDGRLEKPDDADDDSESSVTSMLKDAGERGEAWLNDSLDKFETQMENDLQTVRVARDLKQRWPADYERLQQEGLQIERRARALRDQVKRIADDPLKNLEQIQPAIAAVDQLRRDAQWIRGETQRLQQQMRSDRVALQTAKDHDVQYVRERLRLDQLDGDSLTEYLLGPVWAERIELAVRWIERGRAIVPTESELPKRDPHQGISVIFPGFPQHPDVLVRKLHLDGQGTAEGKPYAFHGTLTDLTHQPWRYAEPARLKIESDGAIRMQLAAVLDRRGDQPIDEYRIDLPAVRQHGQRLGNPRQFAVDVSPGVARIHALIQVRGNELDGTIHLQQDELQLKPQLADAYTKYVSAESVSSAMSGVQFLRAEVKLEGTLKRPRYRVQSNLGPELSRGLHLAWQQELARRQQELVAKVNQEVESELNDLQAELQTKQGKLLEQLEIGDEQLGMFKQHLLSHLGSPKELISRGKNLLFKK